MTSMFPKPGTIMHRSHGATAPSLESIGFGWLFLSSLSDLNVKHVDPNCSKVELVKSIKNP